MFRENLLQLMKEKNMSLKELAYLTNIKAGVLSSYIDNRQSVPNVNYGVKIADALGTTVEFLVCGTNRKQCFICEYESLVKKMKKLSNKKLETVSKVIDSLIANDDH